LDDFRIKHIDHQGLGLFSTRSYSPNELIIEYCGEIIPADRASAGLRGSKSEFILNFVDGYTLDVTAHASAARFINHSCHPNARLQLWHVNGAPRLGVFAAKAIASDIQITCDYNAGGFFNYGARRKLPCYCRSFNCAGYIDTGVESRPVLARKRVIVDEEDEDEKPAATLSHRPSLVTILKYRQPLTTPKQASLQVSEPKPGKLSNSSDSSREAGKTSSSCGSDAVTAADIGSTEFAKMEQPDSIAIANGDCATSSKTLVDDNSDDGVEIKRVASRSESEKRKIELPAVDTGDVELHLKSPPVSSLTVSQPQLFNVLPAVVAQHQEPLPACTPGDSLHQMKQENSLSRSEDSHNVGNSGSRSFSQNANFIVPISRSSSQISLSLQSILNKTPPPAVVARPESSVTPTPLEPGLYHSHHRFDTETGSSPRDMSINSILSGYSEENDEVVMDLSRHPISALTPNYEKEKRYKFPGHDDDTTIPPPNLPIYHRASSFFDPVNGGTLHLPHFGSPSRSIASNSCNNLLKFGSGSSWNSRSTAETAKSEAAVSPKLELPKVIPRPFSSVSYTHLPATNESSENRPAAAAADPKAKPTCSGTSVTIVDDDAGAGNTHIADASVVPSRPVSDPSAGWEKLSISNLLS
jgi:hypothetical protein